MKRESKWIITASCHHQFQASSDIQWLDSQR